MTNKPKSLNGPKNPSRRQFLAAAGATVASINTAACIRKPMERILPYGKRPEDLVPGQPEYYATSVNFGESVLGLLVCSNDGRPTKIEGNPQHATSRGATNAWAQATVLALYDPERSRTARKGDESVEPEKVTTMLAELAATLDESKGKGLAVVIDRTPSPTLDRLLSQLAKKAPKAKLYAHDEAASNNPILGGELVGLSDLTWTYDGSPRVIASFDADPMATEGDTVAFSALYAAGRNPELETDKASRLYAAEPYMTVTGSNADHRLAFPGSRIKDLLAAVSEHLREAGAALPQLAVPDDVKSLPWTKVLAKDRMAAPKGETLVVVGERQPPLVHALGFLINASLGNFGKTIVFSARSRPKAGTLAELVSSSKAGGVKQLLVLGGNPMHDASGDLPVQEVFANAEMTVHLGLYNDETGQASEWHIPMSHYLEAWGDLVARDGSVSIQQPLIAPLYESRSAIEVLAKIVGETEASGYEMVRATLEPLSSEDFEKNWQVWLHDGVGPKGEAVSAAVKPQAVASTWSSGPAENGFELDFVRDATILDGRFGNSPWLQELPDPITKLTWDNAAIVSPATAKKLGVKESGQMIKVAHHGESVLMPAWVQEGTADEVIVLPIGYGREAGGKFAKSGFAVGKLRLDAAPWILTGASAKGTSKTYELACTQVETSLYGRPHIRSATRTDFTEDENFVGKFEVMDESHIRTFLWDEPFKEVENRWGMTIDLNSCTGCGTCTVACQAENNIPWVGKAEVIKGREMHWIRIDRYIQEDGQAPEVRHQPLNCQQCETAPCENVCPVAATVHSPEGLNDMVYNRCIGTRYCANNCPYKVRRFNFFHYTVRNDADYGMGIAMQRNPDVTVRFRGVMEKCTYCVQRINRARIDAKVHGDGTIQDNITPACAQACPTQAITFGNLNDKSSKVTKTAEDPRNYSILAELNTRPRTTYLARLTNPNPQLTNG